MAKLTLKQLEDHQDAMLNTLEKEYESAWKEAKKALDKVDLIAETMAKFQTQILLAQTSWKMEDKN